jgi:hypothetical protein
MLRGVNRLLVVTVKFLYLTHVGLHSVADMHSVMSNTDVFANQSTYCC